MFATEAEVTEPRAESLTFREEKTMCGGKWEGCDTP